MLLFKSLYPDPSYRALVGAERYPSEQVILRVQPAANELTVSLLRAEGAIAGTVVDSSGPASTTP